MALRFTALPENADTLVRDVFYRSNVAISRLDYMLGLKLEKEVGEKVLRLNRVVNEVDL